MPFIEVEFRCEINFVSRKQVIQKGEEYIVDADDDTEHLAKDEARSIIPARDNVN